MVGQVSEEFGDGHTAWFISNGVLDVQGIIVDMTQGYDIVITVDEISRFERVRGVWLYVDGQID